MHLHESGPRWWLNYPGRPGSDIQASILTYRDLTILADPVAAVATTDSDLPAASRPDLIDQQDRYECIRFLSVVDASWITSNQLNPEQYQRQQCVLEADSFACEQGEDATERKLRA